MMKRNMSNAPVQPEKKKTEKPYQAMLKKIYQRVSHRFGWKVLSLLLAVLLWGGLISQDTTLPRPKEIKNVKVNVTNASVLRQNGFIVVSGLEGLETVDITAEVPQRYYSTASQANYNVRADLSQIKSAGEQTIKLTASPTNSTMYGTVTNVSISQVTVQVEEYVVRTRVPVQLQVIGTAPEGYYAANPICDPARVDISGPKSVVNQVVRCVAQYDVSKLPAAPGTARTSVSFVFHDQNGKKLDGSLLSVTSQSIGLSELIVEQELYPMAEVKVNTDGLVAGDPAEGYEVVKVSVYPETVKIAAADISWYLEEGALIFPEGRLNIAGETRSMTGVLPLRNKSGIVYNSASAVTVVVEIAPAGSQGKTEQAE